MDKKADNKTCDWMAKDDNMIWGRGSCCYLLPDEPLPWACLDVLTWGRFSCNLIENPTHIYLDNNNGGSRGNDTEMLNLRKISCKRDISR